MPAPPKSDEIIDLNDQGTRKPAAETKATVAPKPKKAKAKKPSIKAPPLPPQLQEKAGKKRKRRGKNQDEGEEEFWQLVE